MIGQSFWSGAVSLCARRSKLGSGASQPNLSSMHVRERTDPLSPDRRASSTGVCLHGLVVFFLSIWISSASMT
jgi:hypothetical protein